MPHWGASNEYPQHMFSWRTGENCPIIIIKYSPLIISQHLVNLLLFFFYKGGNFCDIGFVFLHTKPYWKEFTLKGKNMLPLGAIVFLLDSFQKGGKTILTELSSLKLYQFLLKKKQNKTTSNSVFRENRCPLTMNFPFSTAVTLKIRSRSPKFNVLCYVPIMYPWKLVRI